MQCHSEKFHFNHVSQNTHRFCIILKPFFKRPNGQFFKCSSNSTLKVGTGQSLHRILSSIRCIKVVLDTPLSLEQLIFLILNFHLSLSWLVEVFFFFLIIFHLCMFQQKNEINTSRDVASLKVMEKGEF